MKINGKTIRLGWISGMPRSGTTWLSQIFASSPDVRLKFCPLFSFEFKNDLDETSTAEQWNKLFSKLYNTNSEFLDQEHLRKRGLVPTFVGKHENPGHLVIKSNRFHNLTSNMLEAIDQILFIHLVRHPCATIYSWLSNPAEFPESADQLQEWRSGSCRKDGPGEFWGFDDWKSVTTQALRLSAKYPNRHKIVRYEDLLKNTKQCAKQLFDFFHLQYAKDTESFIEYTHSRHDDHKHSIFKNPSLIDKWQEMLDPSIISICLREIHGTELEQFITN